MWYFQQVKTLANEVLKLLNKKGMEITEWLLEKYQFIEPAYTEVKDIVKKAPSCWVWKSLTVFIGRFDEVVTFIGYNCVCFCSGEISGKELISQTHKYVDNLKKSSAKPIVGAVVKVGVGTRVVLVVWQML